MKDNLLDAALFRDFGLRTSQRQSPRAFAFLDRIDKMIISTALFFLAQ